MRMQQLLWYVNLSTDVWQCPPDTYTLSLGSLNFSFGWCLHLKIIQNLLVTVHLFLFFILYRSIICLIISLICKLTSKSFAACFLNWSIASRASGTLIWLLFFISVSLLFRVCGFASAVIALPKSERLCWKFLEIGPCQFCTFAQSPPLAASKKPLIQSPRSACERIIQKNGNWEKAGCISRLQNCTDGQKSASSSNQTSYPYKPGWGHCFAVRGWHIPVTFLMQLAGRLIIATWVFSHRYRLFWTTRGFRSYKKGGRAEALPLWGWLD